MRAREFWIECYAKSCASYCAGEACEKVELDDKGRCTEYSEVSPVQCGCGKMQYPGEMVIVSWSLHKVCKKCAKAGKIQ